MVPLKMVEAIDDGRIVRVPEDYAVREGLLILRKPQAPVSAQPLVEERPEKRSSGLDAFRKPLRYKQNDVVGSLVDHFHWIVGQKRKERGLTRKQVATAVQCSEHAIKMIENGILPAENYILINRIEKFLGVMLRKDGQNYQDSMKNLAMNTNVTSLAIDQVQASVQPLVSSSTSRIASAVRTEKPLKTPRWMERHEQREIVRKEQTYATALVEDAEKMTGSDIQLFDEDKP